MDSQKALTEIVRDIISQSNKKKTRLKVYIYNSSKKNFNKLNSAVRMNETNYPIELICIEQRPEETNGGYYIDLEEFFKLKRF